MNVINSSSILWILTNSEIHFLVWSDHHPLVQVRGSTNEHNMYLDINRLAISDTTYHGLLWKPDPVKQISQETLASHNQRTRLLQFTAISFLQHCPGVMLTVTAKAPNRAIGAASTWPRHLQHPFLYGPRAWHLPKGLDFFMPSLCSQALNIKQQPSYLFP